MKSAALLALVAVTAFSATAAADVPNWDDRYAAAGRVLLDGDSSRAIDELTELVATAPTEPARRAAIEQLRLASERGRRDGRLPAPWSEPPPSPNLKPPETPSVPKGPRGRTVDELLVLGGSLAGYSVATGFWLDALDLKRNPSVGVPLLSVGFGGLAALGFAMLDRSDAFRYAVPQSIATGIDVGAALGLAAAVGAPSAGSSAAAYRRSTTLVWSFATVGGVTGAIVGSVLPATPGRASWVGTTALVTGITIGGVAGAAVGKSSRSQLETFGVSAAIGGAVGLGVGFATTTLLSPSMARVRFIDLAWFSGGAISLGGCVASTKCTGSAALASLAVGTSVGFLAGFFGTWGLAPEKLPRRETGAFRLAPYVAPEANGVSIGLGGAM